VTETKNRGLLFPLPDDLPEDQLPEPIELTPEQLAAQAVEEQRDRQRRLDWAVTVQALNDNAMAVTRAMRRFRDESEQDQVERVLSSYEDGRFLEEMLLRAKEATELGIS
jgi:hypothetical protein